MPLTKALIINLDKSLPIPVMFNPSEYQFQKTSNYAEIKIPGCEVSKHQFIQGDSQTMTFELFYDTTVMSDILPVPDYSPGMDVRFLAHTVISLTELNPDTHIPPRLLFVWGTLAFPCIMTNVSVKYEYFNAAGCPRRARLTVTLKENEPLDEAQARIKLESTDRTKVVVLKSGDTLHSIAAKEYEDPGRWRVIARENNIDNPLTLKTGTMLKLPTL